MVYQSRGHRLRTEIDDKCFKMHALKEKVCSITGMKISDAEFTLAFKYADVYLTPKTKKILDTVERLLDATF